MQLPLQLALRRITERVDPADLLREGNPQQRVLRLLEPFELRLNLSLRLFQIAGERESIEHRQQTARPGDVHDDRDRDPRAPERRPRLVRKTPERQIRQLAEHRARPHMSTAGQTDRVRLPYPLVRMSLWAPRLTGACRAGRGFQGPRSVRSFR